MRVPVVVLLLIVAVVLIARVPQRVSAIGEENRAWSLAHSGQTAGAIPHFQSAARLDGTVYRYHNNLGWYLFKMGRSTEALPECQAAVRLNPRSSESRDSLGAVLISLKRYPEAVAACGNAVRLKPLAAHQLILGMALYLNGQRSEGRSEWSQAAASFDDTSANQANTYLQQYLQ